MFCVRHKQPALFDYKQDEPVKAHLILLAHGSKDSNWCRTFELGLGTINNRLEKNASLAYMEMAVPSLENVISKYYLLGEREFEVLPLFFAAGRHLLHDVPEKIARMNGQYKGINITLLDEVGSYDAFWTGLGELIASNHPSSKAVHASESTGIRPHA